MKKKETVFDATVNPGGGLTLTAHDVDLTTGTVSKAKRPAGGKGVPVPAMPLSKILAGHAGKVLAEEEFLEGLQMRKKAEEFEDDLDSLVGDTIANAVLED